MITVALEGPSGVGKTTTLDRLLGCIIGTNVSVLHFPCYSDAFETGGPRARTRTTQEQLDAFHAFMRVESERVDAVRRANPAPELVLLDRSVDTLLAHCKAVDRAIEGSSYGGARREIVRRPYLTPDLTIYFDCPAEILKMRVRHERNTLDDFLVDSAFLRDFPAHFQSGKDLISREVRKIDASRAIDVVTSEVVAMILSAVGIDDATKS